MAQVWVTNAAIIWFFFDWLPIENVGEMSRVTRYTARTHVISISDTCHTIQSAAGSVTPLTCTLYANWRARHQLWKTVLSFADLGTVSQMSQCAPADIDSEYQLKVIVQPTLRWHCFIRLVECRDSVCTVYCPQCVIWHKHCIIPSSEATVISQWHNTSSWMGTVPQLAEIQYLTLYGHSTSIGTDTILQLVWA